MLVVSQYVFYVCVASKRPVLIANLIAARTVCRFGLHLSPSLLSCLPESTADCLSRGSSHRADRTRNWSIVSCRTERA
ncbi:E3 ubiquitin-protein ligase [Fusarium oxysporum f. sp. albedinis]|nr:E3 ubiquitin-protein ligase [Fusarium oxysporum f. sp. albedinis]